MYAKVFRQIFDSSINDNYQVRFVFEDLLKLCDINGVVDMTHSAIARVTNVPLEIVTEGIKRLEEPDEKSRSKDFQGRRIVRLDEHRDWGWFIVNYEHYRKLASEEERREKTLERVRRFRAKLTNSTVLDDGNACNALVTPGNAGNDMKKQMKKQKEKKKEQSQKPKTDYDLFTEKWAALYKQDLGEVFVLTKPKASEIGYTMLRRGGLDDAAILAVARKAWAVRDVKFTKTSKSSDMEHFLKEFMVMRDAVKEQRQQVEQKSIAHTGGNY